MPLSGYIKLHRSLLDWSWHDDPNTLSVWIHLLLKANFKPTEWRGIILQPGQLITSRASLAKETGLSEREIRTAMNRLKTSGCLTIEATNRYTVVSVANFRFFQGISEIEDQQNDQHNDQPATSGRPADDHSVRRKECKDIVCGARKRFTPPTVDDVVAYCDERGYAVDAHSFLDYYTSNGWRVGKNPMKDWKAAVRRWSKNDAGAAMREGERSDRRSEPYGGYGAL